MKEIILQCPHQVGDKKFVIHYGEIIEVDIEHITVVHTEWIKRLENKPQTRWEYYVHARGSVGSFRIDEKDLFATPEDLIAHLRVTLAARTKTKP